MKEGAAIPRSLVRIDLARARSSVAEDAKRYRRLALKLGASEAEVIEASSIPVDDRVLLKCCVPKCSGYGTSANCPPHSPSPEKTRQFLSRFRTALVFRVPVGPEVIVRDPDRKKDLQAIRRSLYKLVAALESAAFYDGHYFATGFASGSCKSAYCSDLDCAVLMGEKCRRKLMARPAMEAVGIDCFALADSLGWEMYPIGGSVPATSVPAGFLTGLVLIE